MSLGFPLYPFPTRITLPNVHEISRTQKLVLHIHKNLACIGLSIDQLIACSSLVGVASVDDPGGMTKTLGPQSMSCTT